MKHHRKRTHKSTRRKHHHARREYIGKKDKIDTESQKTFIKKSSKLNSKVSDYTLENINRIDSSRFNFSSLEYPKNAVETNLVESDWFPSEPYTVFIDDMILCANIKVTTHHVHFHLVCGYNKEKEFAGAEEYYSKLRKHLIVRKDRVKVFKINGKNNYYLKTIPVDWDKLYVYGEKESDHFWKKYKKPWDSYQWYVDWLLEKNKDKLKQIGKENYLVNRTSGESIVAESLKKLNIRYIPEYKLDTLVGDKSSYRLADFYLPKEDIYIEVNGGINAFHKETREKETLRYDEKKKVYEKNKLRFIYIFPIDLSHVEYILSKSIASLIKTGKISEEILKKQNANINDHMSQLINENDYYKDKISTLYEKLNELEENSIQFKISKPLIELKKSIKENLLLNKKIRTEQTKLTKENKLRSLLDEREALREELDQIEKKMDELTNTPIGNIKKLFKEVFKK